MLAEFQLLSDFENQLDLLKRAFMRALDSLGKADRSNAPHALGEVHDAALKYFNYAERFARDCVLLDASRDSSWIVGIAEDCYTILCTLVNYYQMLQTECRSQGIDYATYAPVCFSYSSMQRLVLNNLTRDAIGFLPDIFAGLRLPIDGFLDGCAPADRSAELAQRPDRISFLPKGRQLRVSLAERYQTVDELQAFLLDYFPDVAKRINGQMTTTAILNILLQLHEPSEVESAIQLDTIHSDT